MTGKVTDRKTIVNRKSIFLEVPVVAVVLPPSAVALVKYLFSGPKPDPKGDRQ